MENKKEAKEETKGIKENKEAQGKTVSLTESEYLKLKEEAAKSKEYWDRLLRLQADFENTRKRLDRDKQEFMRYANEGIVLELLNILDDLERTVELAQSKHEDLPTFLKGVEMVLAHLYEMLKEQGIKPIEAEGKIFDPNYHEALMQVENNDLPEHTIIEELQKGYTLNGKVVRTTKAKVTKRNLPAKDAGVNNNK
jgi:molecular chaperone GrpE